MSWFTSLFSGPKTSSPPIEPLEPPKRLLEESSRPAPISTHNPTQPSTSTSTTSLPSTDRPNRNKLIFTTGLACFALSLLITRRAFARRRLLTKPAFYTNAPGHHETQSRQVSGAMEAVEALNIATVNVLSVALMATGGTLWYLDINSLDEGRRFLRGGLGVDGSGKSEREAEEEFEEWMASTLARKEEKEMARRGGGGKGRVVEG